jgi:hypothetical protein
MPNNIPHNAYTNAPQQHPNLILGSLQVLFWVFFRLTVWRNHLTRIFAAPNIGSNKKSRLLSEVLTQVYLVLPLLANLILCLMLQKFGKSAENIPIWIGLGVALSVWLRLGSIIAGLNTQRRKTLLLEWLVMSVLAVGIAGIVFGVTLSFALRVLVVLVLFLLGTLAFFGRFQWTWFFGLTWFFGVVAIVLIALPFVLGVPVLPVLSGFKLGLTILVVFLGGLTFFAALMGKLSWGMAFTIICTVLIIFAFTPVSTLDSSFLLLVIGVTINLWRPVIFYPFFSLSNLLLYQLDKQRTDNKTLLRWHSAFWDELQYIPLIGLDKHLILVIKRNPVEGQAALEYLNKSRQRWAAQAAQIELDIRRLEHCADVETIRQAHRILGTGELESSVSTLLNIFGDISENVDAALNQISVYNQRKLLNAVAERLNANLQEISRSSNKYAPRFYPIAQSWLNIISKHIEELVKATELRQEIDDPYIIGKPLNEQLEIFTGRTSIGLRIEQLLIDHRRPPLLLYGQRRMGKTSLLNNLGKLLPNTIIPMFVDLQGAPASASDLAGFLYNLAREMVKSAKKQGVTLPPLTREALTSDPFTSFDEWLDTVEQKLEQNTALLMLDEFEVLDSAIAKGRFDEQDVLGMLRHLIQHRPRFKVLLAGSHTIEEYQRWASYLINVQVVHISYLKEAEARQLIERPVKDFTLRYEPDAVERVLQLTRCHPFLIQLLCAEIIALKNEQDPSIRRLATLADVEAAIPEAFKSGGFFFADIQNNQVDDNGRAILRFIAAQGEGAIALHQTLSQQFPHTDITRKLLLQRELIEEVGEGDRFQVELIRRWFALDS